MASWCKKRITNQDLLVRFGDGKHRFYLESVCAEPTVEGNLCAYCSRVVAQTKTQDVKTFPHGLVTGEYAPDSHIFDSPWYHKKVKAYGEPLKQDVDIAMEAQTRAKAGRKTKTVKDLVVTEGDAVAAEVVKAADPPVAKEPAKPRGRKPKTVTEDAEEKPKKPRAKKTVLEEPKEEAVKEDMNVVTAIPAEVTHVESMDDPIVVREIIKVCLKPFSHDGSNYWRDVEREKLYKRSKDGKRGDYVGRWDSARQRLVREAPDSDADSCV
jgi:hypothetical protein